MATISTFDGIKGCPPGIDRKVRRGLVVDYYPVGPAGIKDSPPQVAIVTKVLTPDVVNLQIFYDAASISARSAVPRRTTNSDFSCWDFNSEE